MSLVCLDLFSGKGGFSKAFEESEEWDVVTVDVEPEFDPDVCADVLDLRPADLLDAIGLDRDEIDVLVVLVGHPCTLFSTAGNHDEWDLEEKVPTGARSREHLTMLFHTIGLVHALAPDYWYLENPRRSRAVWFIGPPDEWVTYCQYGFDYQKPTGLWGDHAPGMTYKRCSRGDPCHTPNTDTDGTSAIASMDRSSHARRSMVPRELSEAILQAVEDAIANPPPEQATLGAAAVQGGGSER